MMFTNSETNLVHGTIESVKTVLPFEVTIHQPSILSDSLTNHTFGVLIGMTGNISGNIIIDGNEEIFQKIGEAMFGMCLEGEMLESFVGELGNMLAGKISTTIFGEGIEMDITPPTILVEETLENPFKRVYKLPFFIDNIGSLLFFLMVEGE